jgi:hypothetical protein
MEDSVKKTWRITESVLEDIDCFETVAEALVKEGASGDYVIRILIKYLRIRHGQPEREDIYSGLNDGIS